MFENVSQQNFTQFVKDNENVVVYFWSLHCGACKAQDPVLQKILQTHSDQLKVARVDTGHNPNLAMAYQILGTPTLMFFKRGNLVRFKSKSGARIDRLVGAQDLRRLQGVIHYLINMKIVEPGNMKSRWNHG